MANKSSNDFNNIILSSYKEQPVDLFINKNELIQNISKVHTTSMGIYRIKKNIKVDIDDVVEYLKDKILNENSVIYKQGKNWYCEIDNIRITINSYSYTIITAHIIK